MFTPSRILAPVVWLVVACGGPATEPCRDGLCTGSSLAIPTPPPAGTTAEQLNDTCETARLATIGANSGTTRGAKRDYDANRCGEPGEVGSGAEVVFRFTPPANHDIVLSVRSQTSGFSPRLYLVAGGASCGASITNGQCVSNPRFQVYDFASELFIVVASASSSDGDFVLDIVGTPRARPATPDAGAPGSVAQAQGSSAESLWKSQENLIRLSDDARRYYLALVQDWTATARRSANSRSEVMTGTLTENNSRQFSWAAGPADRLVVVPRGGRSFSFAVNALSGFLSNPSFPGEGESLRFTFSNGDGTVVGTITNLSHTLSGTGWMTETAPTISTFDITSTTTRNGFSDAQNGRTFIDSTTSLSGAIRESGRDLRFTVSASVVGCVGLNCTDNSVYAERSFDVTSTIGNVAYRLDYQWNTTTPYGGTPTITFNGLITSNGRQVGLLERRLISQLASANIYGLDIVLGQSRYLIDTVQSRP